MAGPKVILEEQVLMALLATPVTADGEITAKAFVYTFKAFLRDAEDYDRDGWEAFVGRWRDEGFQVTAGEEEFYDTQ